MNWLYLLLYKIISFVIIKKSINFLVINNKNQEIIAEQIYDLIHFSINSYLLFIFFRKSKIITKNGAMKFNNIFVSISNKKLVNKIWYLEIFHYLISIIYIVKFKNFRRSDHYIFLVHHFLALSLILMGSRFGLMGVFYILLIHDVNDIFLCFLHLHGFAKKENILIDIGLVTILFFTWIYTRIYCLGYFIYDGFEKIFLALFKMNKLELIAPKMYKFFNNNNNNLLIKLVIATSLFLLLILFNFNLYWLYLIIKGIKLKLLSGKDLIYS